MVIKICLSQTFFCIFSLVLPEGTEEAPPLSDRGPAFVAHLTAHLPPSSWPLTHHLPPDCSPTTFLLNAHQPYSSWPHTHHIDPDYSPSFANLERQIKIKDELNQEFKTCLPEVWCSQKVNDKLGRKSAPKWGILFFCCCHL